MSRQHGVSRWMGAGRGLMLAALAAGAQAQTVSLNGSMGTQQALLVIAGQPHVVLVGSTVRGVRLISLSPAQAEVEVNGQRRVLHAGASQVRIAGIGDSAGDASGQQIVLAAGSGGHFTSAGQINGKAVSFLVDTGASAVAIGQADADRIGLAYKDSPRGFAGTANGRVPVHLVTLNSIRIGDIEVANVEALVMPSAMQHVLLGNTFLTRFQMQRDNDTLRLTRRPN
jgi:aspartyl protease family protein